MNEFTKTYRLFKEAVDYYPTDISTYEGWRELPVKLRAAGLFVHFFRSDNPGISEEQG